ncbi:histidine phosphatase family protein [Sphingomonas profundi]|uniref:histidine phosphatase family protein n=1 Tax=Alterirhizorhabdus profundi TaxID=2681549 RepID=UPI0012E8D6D9|nr:histidine phosphatase family protein [Sphingomonas profundi]
MSAIILHLLRHGEPETPGLLMGRTDGAPTARGIAACVEQTADLAIGAIVASDLARARRAAEAIGEHHRIVPSIDARWRELDFGDWDGSAPATIDPAALSRFWDDPDAHPPPRGERWSGLIARVAAGIAALDGPATLVVTHGGAMRAALAYLCGFAQPQLWAFDLSYGALLTLKVWPGPRPAAQIVGLWP